MIPLTLPRRRRHLARFDIKRVPHLFTDLLVIGTGIAGIRAALEADTSQKVLLVTKGQLNLSNSAWAQGGIAGALDPSDATENHAIDTIRVGCGLCDEPLVHSVVDEAPKLIEELIAMGAEFDRDGDAIALTREGGHSHRRVAHALGDATGREIMRAMGERIMRQDNCDV